jgi:hypothetical protein
MDGEHQKQLGARSELSPIRTERASWDLGDRRWPAKRAWENERISMDERYVIDSFRRSSEAPMFYEIWDLKDERVVAEVYQQEVAEVMLSYLNNKIVFISAPSEPIVPDRLQ